jgi:hypothetical protein
LAEAFDEHAKYLATHPQYTRARAVAKDADAFADALTRCVRMSIRTTASHCLTVGGALVETTGTADTYHINNSRLETRIPVPWNQT